VFAFLLPMLYLSKYIIRNKPDYYRLLSEVTKTGHWEEWILYVIAGIEETAAETLNLVKNIDAFINKTAAEIKQALPELYSRELSQSFSKAFIISLCAGRIWY
jgi:Fic family protein